MARSWGLVALLALTCLSVGFAIGFGVANRLRGPERRAPGSIENEPHGTPIVESPRSIDPASARPLAPPVEPSWRPPGVDVARGWTVATNDRRASLVATVSAGHDLLDVVTGILYRVHGLVASDRDLAEVAITVRVHRDEVVGRFPHGATEEIELGTLSRTGLGAVRDVPSPWRYALDEVVSERLIREIENFRSSYLLPSRPAGERRAWRTRERRRAETDGLEPDQRLGSEAELAIAAWREFAGSSRDWAMGTERAVPDFGEVLAAFFGRVRAELADPAAAAIVAFDEHAISSAASALVFVVELTAGDRRERVAFLGRADHDDAAGWRLTRVVRRDVDVISTFPGLAERLPPRDD